MLSLTSIVNSAGDHASLEDSEDIVFLIFEKLVIFKIRFFFENLQ